ncbi:MAG: SDR family NAD(P)-dependent oxidoreductase [Acidimicrobiales bacterium]
MSADLGAESAGRAPGRARLVGRRVLVVGAGTRASDDPAAPVGNGRAISVLAAREGATVAAADLDAASAQETAELARAEGAEAVVLVADVSDAAACERLVLDAVDSMGGLDGVVVNVGIGRGRRMGGTTIEEWDAVVAVNLRAHFAVARAALPVLDPGSSLVFIGSVAGLRPGTNIPAYDASKAGLAGLMRHVAMEAAPAARANLVVPGLIDTPLGRLASAGRPARATVPLPLGRQGTAWEVAYAAVWLLSAESAYVTGQQLVVDGGLTWGGGG